MASVIEVASGVTGTWQAMIVDHSVDVPEDQGPPELVRSPEFPDGPGARELVVSWVREQLSRIMPDWLEGHGGEAFMTDDEFDAARPEWRELRWEMADGSNRPVTREDVRRSPPPDLTCACMPIRRRAEDARAVIGVILHGPTYWSQDALDSMPTYSESDIADMTAGLRPWPARPN